MWWNLTGIEWFTVTTSHLTIITKAHLEGFNASKTITLYYLFKNYAIVFCLFIAAFISRETSLEWYRRTWQQIPDWNALFMIPRGFYFTTFSLRHCPVLKWFSFTLLKVLLIRCWCRPECFMVKTFGIFCRARLDVNAYIMVTRHTLAFFLPCFFHFSLSFSLMFAHIKAVKVIFGHLLWCCDADPTWAAYFCCPSRLGQNPLHRTWPHYSLFPPALSHVSLRPLPFSTYLFPLFFSPGSRKPSIVFFFFLSQKDCVNPQGQRRKWEKM